MSRTAFIRGGLAVASVILVCLASTARAQHVDLPLRLDLVHDPADYPIAGWSTAEFHGALPFFGLSPEAEGYTTMEPGQTQDPASPTSPYHGWTEAAESIAWHLFPDGVSATTVGVYLYLAGLTPPTSPLFRQLFAPIFGAVTLPQGDIYDDYDATYRLVANGHTFTDDTNSFVAFVSPGVSKVLVRVLVGQADLETYATRIYAGLPDGGGNFPPSALLTTETYPWPGKLPDDVGIWARTHYAKANIDPALPQRFGGWRNVWFTLDTVTDAAGTRVEFSVRNTYLQASVIAIEVHPYAPENEPPVAMDPDDHSFTTNASYGSWGFDDEADMANGIAHLVNGDDPGDALADFGYVNDPLARATGYLWVVGWLGDARSLFGFDQMEWEFLDYALTELDGFLAPYDTSTPPTPADPRLGWALMYRDMAKQYRRALIHERIGGRPRAVMSDGQVFEDWYRTLAPNGSGLLNLNAAEARWRDVGGLQLGATLDTPGTVINPLLFKALVYAAVNNWSRHTRNVNVDTSQNAYYFVKQHFDLAQEFHDQGLHADVSDTYGPTAGLFGEHDALAILNHLSTYDVKDPLMDPDYDENDEYGIVSKWGGEGSDRVHGDGAKWWDELLEPAADIVPDNPACMGDHVWARGLRRFQVALEAGHAWWSANNLVGGELGGGSGDDPEFLLQMVAPTLPFRGSLASIEEGAREIADFRLSEWGDPAEQGAGTYYFSDGEDATAADVEHTAEFTSNALWTMLHIRPGDPEYIEYALRASRFLADTGWQPGQLPWTELGDADPATLFGATTPVHLDPVHGDSIDYRRFRAWYLDAEGADADFTSAEGNPVNGDLALNGRALIPAFLVAAHNGHPELVDLLREWTEWWWVVAMEGVTTAYDNSHTLALTDGTAEQLKPKGVIPSIVDYGPGDFTQTPAPPYLRYGAWEDNNNDCGTGNEWWCGGYGIQIAFTSSDYIYGAFLWRYRDPATGAAASDYLLPMYHAARLVGEYWRTELMHSPLGLEEVHDLSGGTAPGSVAWTAELLAKNAKFKRMLMQYMPAFETDANLPGVLGATKHAALMEYLKAGLGCHRPSSFMGVADITDCESYGKPFYADPATFDVSADEDKDLLAESFGDGYTWLDSFLGMATTFVSYVDRIFLTTGDQSNDSFGSATAGFLTTSFPNYSVTWETPEPGLHPVFDDPLEVAPLVKGFGDDGVWRALVVHFEAAQRTLRLRLWNGLPPGRYDVYVGDNAGDDTLSGAGTFVETVEVGLFASQASVDIDLPADDGSGCGRETVIELRPGAPGYTAPAAIADLAISDVGFDIYLAEDAMGDVYIHFDLPAVHNLGTQASPANVPVDLELHHDLDLDETYDPLTPLPVGPVPAIPGQSGFTPLAPFDGLAQDPIEWSQFGVQLVPLKATVRIIPPAGTGDVEINNVITKHFVLDESALP